MSLMLFFLWLLCICNFVSVAHPPMWDLSHARGPCLASPEAIILSHGCSWGTVQGVGGVFARESMELSKEGMFSCREGREKVLLWGQARSCFP